MGTSEAVDADAVQLIRDVAQSIGSGTEVSPDISRVGSLMPLTGALGEELWGGYKALNFSAWGGVTSNMHWDRFLERVRSTPWADPQRVQLLLKEDGDTYFRLYMFQGGQLTNVVPPPPGGGYDQDW